VPPFVQIVPSFPADDEHSPGAMIQVLEVDDLVPSKYGARCQLNKKDTQLGSTNTPISTVKKILHWFQHVLSDVIISEFEVTCHHPVGA
jgi:hypothetical protein